MKISSVGIDRCFRVAALIFALLAITLWGAVENPARAEACNAETEGVRGAEGSSLPDCRAYEQVSPPEKNTTDAVGSPGYVHSSTLGESVSYYSIVPFAGLGSPEFPSYLSTRASEGWSTQGLLPLTQAGADSEVRGATEDNEEILLMVSSESEERFLLAPEAELEHTNSYIYNTATHVYDLVGTRVGSEVNFADATPDGSHVLFTSAGHELVSGVVDEEGVPYLYEWNRETGKLSFIGEVNGKAPEAGTVAGSNENKGASTYDQDTMSENGSRIYFSEDGENEKVYLREPASSRTIEVSKGKAQWWDATPDGSTAFYTENKNLYKFSAEGDTSTPIAEGAAEVLGVAGISTDGSYVYFVADGVLAGNQNGNGEKAETGKANLYVWHEGTATPTAFIAQLNPFFDVSDWEAFVHDEPGGPDGGYKGSRVSADGTKLLITSKAKLTTYDNADRYEIYLYGATEPLSTTNPRCLSCSSMGSAAIYETYLASHGQTAPSPPNPTITRNLSAEGTRVFFQTEEALLPRATDGQMNVYEWERENIGSCEGQSVNDSGGCLYLISTGTSTSPSYFGDASSSGSDVFFFTRQSLVSQDEDDNVDVYDARENGGLESQNPAPAKACVGESECRAASQSQGVAFGVPSSATFTGSGNLAPPLPPPSEAQPPVKPKPLTRAQRLAKALKACRSRSKRDRARCDARARRSYGIKVVKRGARK